MIEIWTCSSCQHYFTPENIDNEVQCPRCGALQDFPAKPSKPEKAAPQKRKQEDLRDLEFTQAEQPSLESAAPGISKNVQAQAPDPARHEATRPHAQKGAPPPPSPVAPQAPPSLPHPPVMPAQAEPAPTEPPPEPNAWHTVGPLILVCVLFLGWVFYDKLFPRSTTALMQNQMKEAIILLRMGDEIAARQSIDQALILEPKSEVAKELQKLIDHQRTKPKSPLSNQMNSVPPPP